MDELQKKASAKNLQIGVDVSNRMRTEENRHLLKISFSDLHEDDSVEELITFLKEEFLIPSLTANPLPDF